MSISSDQFRSQVYGCDLCTNISEFRRPRPAQPFYKFPPIIGAQKPVPLLFVGINPRRSATNERLHEWLSKSAQAFSQLAGNRDDSGLPYIGVNSAEEHYRCHALIVEGVFGAGTEFESAAAVTELYLCASESGSKLLQNGPSACAAKYLGGVIHVVQPKVIVAVGATVRAHLTTHFRDFIEVPLVEMVHPRFLHGLSSSEKEKRLQQTIQRVAKCCQMITQPQSGKSQHII